MELEENGDLVNEVPTNEESEESDMHEPSPLHAVDNNLRKRAMQLELEGLLKIKFGSSCLSTLEELLHDVYVAYRPSSDDYSRRGELVHYYSVAAAEVFGKHKASVEAYGSFLMDMFSPTSDLDLSINFSSDSDELPRAKKIKALRMFSKMLYRLQGQGRISGVNPIMSARVPILKFVECGTGIECDISIENKDGILKSHFVAIVSAIDERFQKLSILMKTWANVHGINSSRDGTLNSISIILLVALHLQTRDPPILPPFSALLKDGTNPGSVGSVVAKKYLQFGKGNIESLATLFTSLLSKLASVEHLWCEGLCASAYEGSWISKKGNSKKGCISVEDFLDPSQNVARAVGRIAANGIYKCINSSLHQLSEFLEGHIETSELKLLLFGGESVPRQLKGMKIGKMTQQRKKKQRKAALLKYVATIESGQKEGFCSEVGVQTVGAIQNQSPESPPSVKNPKKSKKKKSEKGTLPNPVSRKKSRETVAAVQNHPLSVTAHIPPKLSHGFHHQTVDTIQNHMHPMCSPVSHKRPPVFVPGFGHEFQNFPPGFGFNEVRDPTRVPMFNGGGQWERHHPGPVFQNHPLRAPAPAENHSFQISRFGHDFHKFPTGFPEPVEHNREWGLPHPMYPTTNGGQHWRGHPVIQNLPHPPAGYNGVSDSRGPLYPTNNGGEQWGGQPATQNHPHPGAGAVRYNGASDPRGPFYPTSNGGEQWGGHQKGPIFQNHPLPTSAPGGYNNFQHGPGGQHGGQQTGPTFGNHQLPISGPVGYNGALDAKRGPVSVRSNGGGQQTGFAFQNQPPPVSAPVWHNEASVWQHGPVSATSNGGMQYGGQQTGPIVQKNQVPVSAPVVSKGAWIPPPQAGYKGAGVPQQGSISSTSTDAAKYRAGDNHPRPSSGPVGLNGAWSSQQQGTMSASNGGRQLGGGENHMVPDSVPVASNGMWVSQRGPVSTSNVSRHEGHQNGVVGHGSDKVPTGFTTNKGGQWRSLGS